MLLLSSEGGWGDPSEGCVGGGEGKREREKEEREWGCRLAIAHVCLYATRSVESAADTWDEQIKLDAIHQ